MTKSISLAILAICTTLAFAEVPSTMIFQGAVTQSGLAVTGKKDVTISLYDSATGGTQVWVNQFTGVKFSNNGYFGIDLSTANSALPSFDKPLFAEIIVDGKTGDSRIALSTTPYAMRSAIADSAYSAHKAVTASQADSAISISPDAAVTALNGRTGSLSIAGYNGIAVQTNSNGINLLLDSKPRFADTVTASAFREEIQKTHIMDIGGSPFHIYSSNPNWKLVSGSLEAVCTSGAIGPLQAAVMVDLPEGAIVDSMSMYSQDNVGFPIYSNLNITSFITPTSSIVAGAAFTVQPKLNSGRLLQIYGGSNYFKRNDPAIANTIISKEDRVYKINIGSTNTTVPCNASGTNVMIYKMSLYYRLPTL